MSDRRLRAHYVLGVRIWSFSGEGDDLVLHHAVHFLSRNFHPEKDVRGVVSKAETGFMELHRTPPWISGAPSAWHLL